MHKSLKLLILNKNHQANLHECMNEEKQKNTLTCKYIKYYFFACPRGSHSEGEKSINKLAKLCKHYTKH